MGCGTSRNIILAEEPTRINPDTSDAKIEAVKQPSQVNVVPQKVASPQNSTSSKKIVVTQKNVSPQNHVPAPVEIKECAFRGAVCQISEADAIGWGMENPNGPLVKIPFKHPALDEFDVRIDITFTGLCYSDVLKATGGWGNKGYWPLIPGHEVFGRVSKVGDKVISVKEGDLVGCGAFRDCCGSCPACRKGFEHLCEVIEHKFLCDPHFGGFATSIQLSSKFVFKIPEGLDEKICAPLMCAGTSVYAPLKKYARPGYVCAVAGIGGLGHLAIQYSHKLGIKTVAISQSDDKKELAQKLGADMFVNSNDQAQMSDLEKEGVDILINTMPISDIRRYLKLLKAGTGILVQIGLTAENRGVDLATIDIISRQITIAGGMVGSRKETREMLEFSAEHQIYPMVETYSFDDFPKAFNRLRNEKPLFRCVVDVKDRKELI